MARTAPRKSTSKPDVPEEPTGDVAWTIRMPAALAARIKAHAKQLSDEGGGLWSGNRVVVKALEEAASRWTDEGK